MIVRTAYPAGVPCWLELGAPDPAAAAEFMAGLSGWEIEPGGDRLLARLDGHPVAAVGVGEPGWWTAVAVPDAVEAAACGDR